MPKNLPRVVWAQTGISRRVGVKVKPKYLTWRVCIFPGTNTKQTSTIPCLGPQQVPLHFVGDGWLNRKCGPCDLCECNKLTASYPPQPSQRLAGKDAWGKETKMYILLFVSPCEHSCSILKHSFCQLSRAQTETWKNWWQGWAKTLY